MAIQNYKTYNDKERGFEDFDAFLANPEPSPGDVEAVELLKHALMHHAPYDDRIFPPMGADIQLSHCRIGGN